MRIRQTISIIFLCAVTVIVVFFVMTFPFKNTGSDVKQPPLSAIYVPNQEPGQFVITTGLAVLQQDGFIVVRETDTSMSLGSIIGSSAFLRAGEYSSTTIALSRKTIEGEPLIAMMYSDDGDGGFNVNTDEPLLNNGKLVWMLVPIVPDPEMIISTESF